MTITDSLGDMITRIRNGQRARLSLVKMPMSMQNIMVLDVLKKEGYIRDYSIDEIRKGIKEISIELKYSNKPAIKEIKRISKPGRRLYSSVKELKKFYNGLGVVILSTSKGIMSDYEARLAKVGGEILCKVF
ncbi:Ribosomal protein S8 [Rickettsiales bacterium Ac37b]|nr:Ribosomal protein S8 [Rickettsiales bacterium Ac37b]